MLSRLFSPTLLAATLLVALIPAAGCNLYFNDDDDTCNDDPGAGYSYRNPETGSCDSFGGGGCGDYDIYPQEDQAAPNMALCYAGCEGLDETDCAAAEECRRTYYDECPECDDTEPNTYLECWGVAPWSDYDQPCNTLDAWGCSGRNDCQAVYTDGWREADSALYQPQYRFVACEDEALITCGDQTCPPNSRCEETCVAGPWGEDGPVECSLMCVPVVPSTCDAVTCGDGFHCVEYCDGAEDPESDSFDPAPGCTPVCEPDEVITCDDSACPPDAHCEISCLPCWPGEDDNGDGMCGCETTCVPNFDGCAAALCEPNTHCEETCGDGGCTVTCEPDDTNNPGECVGEVFCDSLPPMCPESTVAGRRDGCWTGYCIPLTACGPADPGSCYEPVTDDQLTPACPDFTVPGVRDGRYTGFCIPVWQCEGPSGCEAQTTLEACLATDTMDISCAPTFIGTDCTCNAAGVCTCENLAFDSCVSSEGCTGPIIDCAAPPPGCDYVGGGCRDGGWTCGTLVCEDGAP